MSILWHCLSLGLEWKLTFLICGQCWFFQICWHIECSTFTASSFRIWNSLTGIRSSPLALFLVMLPKAHLTLHSRMSGSRWVITPCDYLGCEDLFCIVLLCILATFSLYLLLLLGLYHFCPLLCPSLHEIFLGISNFHFLISFDHIWTLPHIKTVPALLLVVNNYHLGYPPQTPPAPQESKSPLHG